MNRLYHGVNVFLSVQYGIICCWRVSINTIGAQHEIISTNKGFNRNRINHFKKSSIFFEPNHHLPSSDVLNITLGENDI